MTAIVEVFFAFLFKNAKGRDGKAFFTTPAFADHKEQIIKINSPDCGEDGATLAVDYTADGAGTFPALEWTVPESIKGSVKEWLIVTEDPDVPLPTPICHGFVNREAVLRKPEKLIFVLVSTPAWHQRRRVWSTRTLRSRTKAKLC